jgi:hypothetical protein
MGMGEAWCRLVEDLGVCWARGGALQGSGFGGGLGRCGDRKVPSPFQKKNPHRFLGGGLYQVRCNGGLLFLAHEAEKESHAD